MTIHRTSRGLSRKDLGLIRGAILRAVNFEEELIRAWAGSGGIEAKSEIRKSNNLIVRYARLDRTISKLMKGDA